MHVLVSGLFPDAIRAQICRDFPARWQIDIAAPDAVEQFLPQAEVLIPEHLTVDEALLSRAPSLRMVQTGAGYNNVDLAACSRRKIPVCSAPGVNTAAVAEHTLAMILAWYKNIPYLDTFMRSRAPISQLSYSGAELAGHTVGIIGMGAIGRRVARICRSLDLHVLGFSRHPVTERPGGGVAVPIFSAPVRRSR